MNDVHTKGRGREAGKKAGKCGQANVANVAGKCGHVCTMYMHSIVQIFFCKIRDL